MSEIPLDETQAPFYTINRRIEENMLSNSIPTVETLAPSHAVDTMSQKEISASSWWSVEWKKRVMNSEECHMRPEGLVPVPEVGERGRGNCSWIGGRIVHNQDSDATSCR